MKQEEAAYLKGSRSASSAMSTVLSSSSKYLNSVRMRDVFVQEGLRKNGRDVPMAYLVPDALDAFEELKDRPLIDRLLAQERAAKPEFAAWLDARFYSRFTAESTAAYPQGTLGHKVHDFIVNSGYAIDFMFRSEPADDYEYLLKRLAQNHDIEHMVTGFGTDPCGETGLMTCNATSWLRYFGAEFAGEQSRFNVYLSSMNIMKAGLHYPATLLTFYEALRLGGEMGLAIEKPLFLVRWEDYLAWTIPDIRLALKLTVGPEDGAWSWTEDAWQEAP